jgi:SAM-dependent methyltransferase
MSESSSEDLWSSGEAYERYVGRWSRPVAHEFLDWLALPSGLRWLDVGCGTGALTSIILVTQSPASVRGIDPSAAFVGFARENVRDPRAQFAVGDAKDLRDLHDFDSVVSGLALNFVPDPGRAVGEFARVLQPGGVAAVYVWDYADGMQMMRLFWDAAIALDPAAAAFDESPLFPICNSASLAALWNDAGFGNVETRAIEVATTFADFDDYWRPFLAGRAPAPAYAMSLTADRREALRERLRETLTRAGGGPISLRARAWAVKGMIA